MGPVKLAGSLKIILASLALVIALGPLEISAQAGLFSVSEHPDWTRCRAVALRVYDLRRSYFDENQNMFRI